MARWTLFGDARRSESEVLFVLEAPSFVPPMVYSTLARFAAAFRLGQELRNSKAFPSLSLHQTTTRGYMEVLRIYLLLMCEEAA